VTRSKSRSTRGSLGDLRFWEVQHTESANHGWVEAARLPAGVIAGMRTAHAWVLMRGLPVGLVNALDLPLVEPFRSWSMLPSLFDVIRDTAERGSLA
jgi:hypothetical protein